MKLLTGHASNFSQRRRLVFCVFFLLSLACLSRLFYIQYFGKKYLSALARRQQNLFIELAPRRGAILDRNLRPLAIDLSADSLYAIPQRIKDVEGTAARLLPLLSNVGIELSFLKGRLGSSRHFVWIARKLPAETAEKIKDLNLPGLYFIKESQRVYPNRQLASHFIGFAGIDNQGLEGLELYYDRKISGTAGWGVLLRDGRQERLGIWEKLVLPSNGYNLVLTVDEVIQFIVERELARVLKKFRPKAASIVVMQPYTGEILALANAPSFDLNETSRTDYKIRRNRAITDLYEPGSVFKIVTASAALEEAIVKEEDKFFCENGAYRLTRHTFRDHRPYGWLTFQEVIEYSSNIGTIKVAQKMGREVLYEYIKKFGFGAKLGIDLPGEAEGIIRKPADWSELSIGAISFGQEVGVTTLQLVSAISVIANQGKLMQPYLVSEIRSEDGVVIERFYPQILNSVISPQTALRMKEILAGVVEKGTGRLARINGMRVAGKTGTAQKIGSDGRYARDKFVALFIGFAPADDPAIAVAIVVDEPRPVYFGGQVCAPVFKNICEDVIKYLMIQPSSIGEYALRYETEEFD